MDETTLAADAEDLTATAADPSSGAVDEVDEVDEELLIEEVSIDGMCGVY